MFALVVAVALSAPFVVALLSRPLLRRLALRHAARRPIEALLVVLGSLLGTGIITGSLAVGDTIERSIQAEAFDQLGPVDQTVTVSGLDAGARLSAAMEGLDHPVIDGVIVFATAGATVVSTGERPVSQPRAQLVEIDAEEAASFGSDPRITGFAGVETAPTAGQALISADLSDRLGLDAGDRILVYVYARAVTLEVTAVVPRTGLAGWWTVDPRQQAYNVIVAPGTLAAILGDRGVPPDAEPPQVVAAVSNVGGVISGADATDEAVAVVAAHLDDRDRELAARVLPVKRDLLEAAEAGGRSLTQLYFTMGMFAVAAGVLLLVNIFVMLAEERRSELGMLRAIGMRRTPLVTAFAAEGWLYAVVAAALGAMVGIGFGRLIAWRADQILASGSEVTALALTFTVAGSTVLTGFTVGLAIAVITILATSIHISRLNVIAAVRDLPDRPGRRLARRLVAPGLALGALGLGWTIFAVDTGDAYGLMTGPVLVVLGLVPLAARRLGGTTTLTTVASVVVLAWSTASVPVLGLVDIDLDIPVFLVQGLTMAAAAVVLATTHQRAFARLLAAITRDALPVRLGMAYPLARRFRTAMTLAMFAIVVLTLVYISIISAMFRNQVDAITDDLSGGFGLVVGSNPSDPIPAEELAALPDVAAVAPLARGAPEWSFGTVERQVWPLTAFGPELVAAPPALQDRGLYETDREAWQAVLDDPSLVIVDDFFLADVGGPPTGAPRPGDPVVLVDQFTGESRHLTVAALAQNDFVGNGAFYGRQGWRDLVGERAVASRFFVEATDDTAVENIRTTFVARGADAERVRDLVENAVAQQSGFFALMQQFVGAGLVIGIAGIGVLTVRAVRERRRHVGVLRSLGLGPRAVAVTFLVEAVGIAVEGVAIGVLIALVASRGLVLTDNNFAEGLQWTVPLGEVGAIVALALVAASITAAWPASRAARIHPATALRIAD